MKVSVIIPSFNEEGNVFPMIEKLVPILEKYEDYEVIFVDDGSRDSTLQKLKEANSLNKKINYLSFSRNFGHQNALRAGLDYCDGDCAISMDGDLQHPPELIPELIEKWKEGYDIVYTLRGDGKKTSFFKKFTANLFYNMINSMSNINIPKGAADFRLLDRSVVEVLKTFTENTLFLRGLISWLGFKQYGVKYSPCERFSGKTKYSIKKMTMFALTGITSFSVKPLHLSTIIGVILSIIAFFYGIYAILIKLFSNEALPGWTSVLVSVLFIGGVQLIMMGIMGEYVGKLFIESKKRPNYILKDKSL
ncbi:MAG TPA: glycosyltransferase family 2 protein [Spirochaetota bacterium]|nr:glycosyltransferase family 2 protein [Spirochaetota bacterium]